MKKQGKRLLSLILASIIMISIIPLDNVMANTTSSRICLTSLERTSWGRYEGNLGDSRMNVLGETREYGYGNIGVDGTVYENGFEAWVARWNYTAESSWVYATYDLEGKYDQLTGSTGLIGSYNTNNFDTTLYFYGDDILLYSIVLTDESYEFDFRIDVSTINSLKIMVKDNVAVSGGTSFAIYNLFLSELSSSDNSEDSGNLTTEYNRHSYQVLDISLSWEEAKTYCENLGGHLATITSQGEQAFLSELANLSLKKNLWLGALETEEGVYSWVTGEEFIYTNWDSGEPNDYCDSEKYVMMYTNNSEHDVGTWNDTFEEGEIGDYSLSNFGFVCEWDYELGTDHITAKQEKYLRQHIDFINSTTFNTASNDFRYATSLWDNYHGSTSQAVGEFVYDIQEGFFETISFQGMDSLENPYDAIILDILSSKSIKASLSDVVDSSAVSVIDGVIDDLITTFQADSDWENDINIADNFKDLLDMEATDYSSNKLYQSLDKLFEGKSTEQIKSIFSKYDCYSDVLAKISEGAKGVDFFLEILKYTTSIEAYYNASEEFKAILKEVADVMPSVNADYGQKFNETYNNYSSCVDYNSVMQNVLNHVAEEGFWLVTDLMSDVLQDSALTFCKTALKMSESAAGTLVASLWAAETGFNLGNMITDNDTLVNCRRLLRANYMLDEAVHHVMRTHASKLKTNPSYEEALYFDAAFNLFKNLQINSLGLHQKYMKANGSSFINFLIGKQDYFKREAEAQAVIIDTWKNIKCHDDNLIDSITYSKSNTVVVACPTNVYVYCKSDGELVASVINNEVYNSDSTLTVVTESNEKAICLPNLNDYEIKIEATDAGSMSVDYTVSSLERPHYDRAVLFDNVELSDQSSFDFQVDSESNSITLVDQNQGIILPDLDTDDLIFKSASLTLQDDLVINYKVNETLFTEDGYTNPYVIFSLNGVETKVTKYTVENGRYIFDFEDIIPHQINDTIYATLYATYNGVEYASETREYSVATYCYNMLEKYNTDDYAKLRTLLVDLLNYGAVSQVYMNYNIEELVNSSLTEEQKAWGTSTDRTLETVQELEYKTIDNPTVQWKSGGLNLQKSVGMRFKISTENIENLTVKVTNDIGKETIITSEQFEVVEGGYYVFFEGLNAGQMSDIVYLTVYNGETAVSNTIRYSIESYAYVQQNSTDTNLAELVKAMMKYGDSAKAYVS